MKRLMRKLHRDFGRDLLICIGIILLLCHIFLFLYLIVMPCALVFVLWLASAVMSYIFLEASQKKYAPPLVPQRFYHSVDDNGNFIMTNGEKKVSVGEDGEVHSSAPLTLMEMMDIKLACNEILIKQEEEAEKNKTAFDRMMELEDLYNFDLISNDEYEEKRKDILKDL